MKVPFRGQLGKSKKKSWEGIGKMFIELKYTYHHIYQHHTFTYHIDLLLYSSINVREKHAIEKLSMCNISKSKTRGYN